MLPEMPMVFSAGVSATSNLRAPQFASRTALARSRP
jgi:hypothetical protein